MNDELWLKLMVKLDLGSVWMVEGEKKRGWGGGCAGDGGGYGGDRNAAEEEVRRGAEKHDMREHSTRES